MTILKEIVGMKSTNNYFGPAPLVIRCTENELGGTLSIADETQDIMLAVDLEEIEKIINEERRNEERMMF